MSVDPYEVLSDEQVLDRAAQALKRVQGYPIGSVERSIQWAVYESAKAELDLRFMGHVMRRIREQRGEE